MPGGVATQTFTVPPHSSQINSALVQIDPDNTVTAHAALWVNGHVEAKTTAHAAGDTQFSFNPVRVQPGQTITLAISFTATYGKIITMYTVGDPGGSFRAQNNCPDGAPNVSTTSTGLRAVVEGLGH